MLKVILRNWLISSGTPVGWVHRPGVFQGAGPGRENMALGQGIERKKQKASLSSATGSQGSLGESPGPRSQRSASFRGDASDHEGYSEGAPQVTRLWSLKASRLSIEGAIIKISTNRGCLESSLAHGSGLLTPVELRRAKFLGMSWKSHNLANPRKPRRRGHDFPGRHTWNGGWICQVRRRKLHGHSYEWREIDNHTQWNREVLLEQIDTWRHQIQEV